MAAAVKETTRIPRISVSELSPATIATMPTAVESSTGSTTPTESVTIGLTRLRLWRMRSILCDCPRCIPRLRSPSSWNSHALPPLSL